MNGSLRLGSVLGITIRVHVLLLVLIAWLLLATPEAARAAIGVGMIFGTVLLHELGHSVVAMSFGLKVLDITLWPLGGMARMSDIPESSRIEALIAIAGPIVNFVLAAIALPLWLWTEGRGAQDAALHGYLGYFAAINLMMGAFNLVPAFPMDGGRILRAFLGRGGDWVRATERAVRIGRVLAVGIGIVGAATGQYALPFLAVWLWWIGGMELRMVRARHRANPFDAFRASATGGGAAPAGAWSSSASGGWGAAPAPARDEPPPLARDPAEDRVGWSEDDIGRLERFRGPLRSWRDEE